MQAIHIDISNNGVIPAIYAKQGDVGRKFKAILTDGGAAYPVPAGAAVSVWYSGASGEGNYTDIGADSAVSVSGNEITVELITQMLANYGDGKLCLAINTADGDQIGTWNIPYMVELLPGMGSAAAQAYFTAFSQAVQNLPYPDTTLTVAGRAADASAVGTALAGKAPAGYGLGGACRVVANWDDALDCGFYAAPSGLPNGADGSYHHGIVYQLDGWTYQDVKPTAGEVSYGLTRKKLSGGGWKPWEWVNPPMIPGVEYRTTERWNGKPVYKQLINGGGLPAAGSVNIPIPSSGTIDYIISAKGSVTAQRVFPSGKVAGGMSIDLETHSGGIDVYTSHDWLGGAPFYVTAEYTLV